MAVTVPVQLRPGSLTRRPGWLSFVWWVAGAALMLLLGGWAAWGLPTAQELDEARLMLAGGLLAYGGSVVITRRVSAVDIGHIQTTMAAVTTAAAFAGLSVMLLFTRTYYSRSFLLTAAGVALVWLVAGRILKHRLFRPTFAVEPGAVRPEALALRTVDWVPVKSPMRPSVSVDAVVANREVEDPEWQRFHTQCEVSGLPVLHGPLISERLTGRVSLQWLSGGHLAELQPHPVYAPFKRLLDLLIVALTAPVVLPLGILVALAIRLESPGPVFFIQDRVGQGGWLFPMVKFRSMRIDAEDDGAQFADEEDARITRVGRFIRRTRLDELPQFWNVLKGEMSLIGPRPEQREFVEHFETVIAFYGYRHLVKPGITGWAQVMQGYADSDDDTREKLEYDLYYTKHCSIWFDLLIIFRTLRIIVTGFGAR